MIEISHAYGNNLVLLASAHGLNLLANENFDDCWENEGFSKEIEIGEYMQKIILKNGKENLK